jgi:DNA-binding NarL/FixJ family response regulator
MSEKTASVHVSRILSKLGVSNRAEAAGIAHTLGLEPVATGDESPSGL